MILSLGMMGMFFLGLSALMLIGKLLLIPMTLLWKLFANGICGGLLLLAINFVGSFFGFKLPVNALTSLITGFLGVPGLVLVFIISLL